jgi:hypothetical protein
MSTNQLGIGTPGSGRTLLIRWVVAIVGFPIGGFVGHLVAGPAATVPAAAASGLIAGAAVGLAQALALGLRRDALVLWAAATAVGLGVALAAVTLVIGQIDTMVDAAALGAVSGAAIGGAQGFLLVRERVVGMAWLWVPASAVAWAIGWTVTASIGVALEAGWPVFGLSGAVVSQVLTAVVLWRLASRGEVPAAAVA